MASDSCPICVGEYSSKNKSIKCFSCDYCSCSTCTKRYLGTTSLTPNCMNCKIAWNDVFLRSTFPKSWLSKDYKKMREKVLFDLELSKIPDTQVYCRAYIKEKDLVKEKNIVEAEISELKKKISLDSKEYETSTQDVWMDPNNEILKTKSFNIKIALDTLRIDQKILGDKKEALLSCIIHETDFIRGSNTILKQPSIFSSCQKENCKGYVMDGSCGICFSKVCNECQELEETSHSCSESTLETLKLIKQDTHPCPKCSCNIYKISGCDQMWCTMCKTAFSWETGITETLIHNPHYYEWIRSQGKEVPRTDRPRQLLDNCDRTISEDTHHQVVHKIRQITQNEQEKTIVYNIVRLVLHLSQVEMAIPSYKKLVPSDPNRIFRLQYMTNEISEKEFCSILQKKEKDDLKRLEFTNIVSIFIDVADDFVKSYLFQRTSFQDFRAEMIQLRDFVNQRLADISDLFNIKKKFITDNFEEIKTT